MAHDLGQAIHQQGAGEEVEEIDEGAADVDGKHEHQVHDRQEDGDAQGPVEHHAVDAVRAVARGLRLVLHAVLGHPIGEAVAPIRQQDVHIVRQPRAQRLQSFQRHRGVGDAPRQVVAFEQASRQPGGVRTRLLRGPAKERYQLADGLLQAGIMGDLDGRHHPCPDRLGQGVFELIDTLVIHRYHRHHLAAQVLGQLLHIDLHPEGLGHVHHVEGHHQGLAHLQKLGGEIEVTLRIGGVDDVDDQIRLGGMYEIPGDLLVQGDVFASDVQGVGARQVDHFVINPPEAAGTGLALHGDPRPVADPLPGAGQRIEQSGLAAIGVAHDADLVTIRHLSFLHLDGRRLALTQAELETANPELHRVAHGRHPSDAEFGSGGQSHSQQFLAIAASGLFKAEHLPQVADRHVLQIHGIILFVSIRFRVVVIFQVVE